MTAVSTQEGPIPETGLPGTESNPGKARILVVDDEATMQILASTILNKLGYDALAVASGEQAVVSYRDAMVLGEPFAAVVMDLALPGGISGLEATIAIKHLDAGARVIVCSGYLEQQARGAAMEHGFAGVLPKPYSAERLASELRWVLKHHS